MLKKFLYYYTHHLKITRKFLYAMMLFVCITVFFLSINIKHKVSSLLIQEVRTTSHQYLEQYIDNLSNRIGKFNTMLSSIGSNDTIKQELENPTKTEKSYSIIENEIRKILNYQFPYGLYDFTIFPLNFSVSHESIFIKDISKADDDWLKKFQNGQFEKYFIYEEGTFDIPLFTVLKPIYSLDGNQINAVLKLSLSPSKVFKPMAEVGKNKTHPIFIIDKYCHLIYGESFPDTQEYLEELQDNYNYLYDAIQVPDFMATQGVYITSSSSTNGYRAVYYFPYQETIESVEVLNSTINSFIIVLLGCFIGLSFFLSRSLNSRITSILKKINLVSSGNLDISPPIPGKDEIGIFDSCFTDMVVQLKKNVNENYILRMEQKDAEFMALQAQINPHFLFNSLEIINSLIEMEEYDTACIVNTKLSQLLRYSINHNSSGIVTVRDELENMKNYMYIQNVRFQNRYQLHLDIDESCLDYPFIKLVFQPFIENCFNHGFNHKQQTGNIWFSIHSQKDIIKITIQDDGQGITPQDYKNLLEKLSMTSYSFDTKNDSIGLININRRLLLKYGNKYNIHISSPSSKGMRIQIQIPKDLH